MQFNCSPVSNRRGGPNQLEHHEVRDAIDQDEDQGCGHGKFRLDVAIDDAKLTLPGLNVKRVAVGIGVGPP